MTHNYWHFLIFCTYLFFLAGVVFLLNRRKKVYSKKFQSWIYAIALPASFLTGWAFLGMFVTVIRGNLNFLAFYAGVILFSFLFPYLLERMYSILERYNASDIVSFVMTRYQNSPLLKKALLSLIFLVTLPYLALNIKSLEILFSGTGISVWFLLIPGLTMIFFFVYYIREWKSITAIAIQGAVMFLTMLFLTIFILFTVFDGPGDIFSVIQNSPYQDKILISDYENFFSPWNMTILISVFSFLFLPRQFSILSQGINLPRRERIFKISLVTIFFFTVLILFITSLGGSLVASVIQQNLDISAVNEFSLLHFINQKGNLFLYIIFFVGGFSFVLSTLNQQFVALSDILKKHLTLKLRSSLLILIFASFLFSQILGTLYLSKIGTLCLLGIFQLFIPVIGGFVWEKGNSTGATASIITGTLIWLVIGWGGFLSDPSSYIDGKPLLGEYFLTSILPNQVSSNTSHYFFASFFLSIIFSFAAYILFSLKKGIREKIPPVYLGKSHHFHLDNTSFKDILSAFDYDLSLLNTLGFFYNNQNQSFMESELKEYLSTQNISAQLQNLHQRGFITRSSERGNVYYQYNAKHIHSWDLSRFFNTFYSFRQIIENMTFHLQKSKKEIKFRLNQMEQIYKIYLKIGFMRTRKDFFRTIGNYLPRIYPDIIQISYIKKRKPHVLYKTESDSSEDLFSFKINLGSAYLDLKVTKKFNINTLFILEPIIILSYRITEYIGKLKKYTQRLKNLDSIRTHFLSNISHELRTPLVPLKGYLAILKINDKVKQDPDLSEIIETMDKSYQRLESLIENLIVFKELSFDLFHLEKINLMDILFKVILELKNKIDAKSLNIDFPENQLNNIKIEGDREKIEMALIQILDNAVKFNIPEGTIQIRLKDMGENTLLTIEDSGVGMDKETEDQVFEAFFQEEADSTRRYEGTGIGLSLVKKIIVLHGGKIKIRSRKGAGTTVFIELPKKVKPY